MEAQSNKFLTFSLDNEVYGIPIKKVKEIIGLMEVTPIPKTKGYIKGVINLRGKIVPVMDLRLRFGLASKEYNERTCNIVIEIAMGGTPRLIGLIVDTVAEVVNIQPGEIEAPPEYGADIEGHFLMGIGKLKERVILILNIEKILSSEEVDFVKKEIPAVQEVPNTKN